MTFLLITSAPNASMPESVKNPAKFLETQLSPKALSMLQRNKFILPAIVCSFLLSGLNAAQARLLQCAIRHPGGHSETASVHMQGTDVVAIAWQYQRADGSRCVMDVRNASWIAPDHLRLASGCELLFWHQGTRITVAPITDSCARSCTSRQSLEGLLPVAFNLSTGGCASH